MKYNFVQLSDIGTLQKDAMCGMFDHNLSLLSSFSWYFFEDVIGIVKDIGDVSEITSRNFGKQVN